MSGFTRRVADYIWPHRSRILPALAQVCLISALELLEPWPLIKDGRIVEQGALAELVERKGASAAMYGKPEPLRQEDPLALR